MTSVAELSSTACTGARTASPPCPRPAPPPARRWRARPGCSLARIGTGRELGRRERDIPELEECTISGVPPVELEAIAFDVEGDYYSYSDYDRNGDPMDDCPFDYLTVNGKKYCGTSGPSGAVAEDGVIAHCPAPLLDSASRAPQFESVSPESVGGIGKAPRGSTPLTTDSVLAACIRRILLYRQSDDHAPCSGRDGQPQDDHDRHAEGLRLRLRLALVAQALLAQRALHRLHLPHCGERERRGFRLLVARL